MQMLPSLLFGISASLDGLLVGVGFGLRQVRIRIWQNLTISLVTLLGTCLSAALGSRLLSLLPPFFSGCVGSLILMLLGIYYITKWLAASLRNRQAGTGENRELTGASATGALPGLSIWETCFFSLSLSVNNVGIGLSASMAGLPLIPAAASTFGCSILFLLIGNRMGRSQLLQFIGNAADPISGLLLIGLGMIQLVFQRSIN